MRGLITLLFCADYPVMTWTALLRSTRVERSQNHPALPLIADKGP